MKKNKKYMIKEEDLELLIADSLELLENKSITWTKEKKEEHYMVCMRYKEKILKNNSIEEE